MKHPTQPSQKQQTRYKKTTQIVKNIIGNKSLNPLPEAKSDEILAEDFTNFFPNKIKTRRERFHNIPPYEPTKGHMP